MPQRGSTTWPTSPRTHTDTDEDGSDGPTTISRRAVLGAAAMGAGALAVGATGVGRAAALGPSTPPNVRVSPDQSGIDHIVVVMMENRSFDHMMGWLPGANGIQAGLSYLDHEGVSHDTWHLDTYQGLQYGDPDHSYGGGRIQWNHGKLDGFLKAGTDDVFPIGYYTADDLTFYSQMAPDWVTCDGFHASIMGPTFPNRFYMHAAQTDRISNTAVLSALPTIWDSLIAAGVPATYYYSDIPMTALFGSRLTSITKPYATFLSDCAGGTLPSVSYVDPRFLGESTGTAGDDHPFSDIRVGQSFLNDIYTAVTNGPGWAHTVLVITYDEWGGFFDHVNVNTAPDNDPTHALRGFRVPTFVISPYARRGMVDHYLYDHASILAMIEWRFGLAPLTARDRGARPITYALDLRTPPNLAAPQYVVPSAASIHALPSSTAPTEHEQDWLQVGDLARREGYDLGS